MTSFYKTTGKRCFDCACALIGLLLLSPLLLAVTLLVKLTSQGPVFFWQERIGLGRKAFRIVKFRTMLPKSGQRGLLITSASDPRITPVGRILRWLKIDELPQLWNVLKGEMSMVGPRPEVSRYVDSYSDAQMRVFEVRPGITDPASIAYRHEEQLLSSQSDPDLYYRNVLLPDKLRMNLEYIDHLSFTYDCSLLLRTTGSILMPKAITTRPLKTQL
jgi:lipopolysaccharide/colanic/teichoic acid biosynthesis glycosyltransferase